MAVTAVYKLARMEGSRSATDRDDALEYHVVTDGPATIDEIVNASAGGVSIPAINAVNEDDPLQYVRSKTPRTLDPRNYIVSVLCSRRTVREKEPKPEGEGVYWDVDLSGSGVLYTQPAYRAKTSAGVWDTPIVNAAGSRFDPPPQEEYYDEEITLTFSCDVLPRATMNDCRGLCNTTTVEFTWNGQTFTYTARQLKLGNATWQFMYEDGINFWRVTYPLLFRKDTFKTSYLNAGRFTRVGVSTNRKPIKATDGSDVTEDQLLTADGTAVTATANFRDFSIEREADLNTLFTGLFTP